MHRIVYHDYSDRLLYMTLPDKVNTFSQPISISVTDTPLAIHYSQELILRKLLQDLFENRKNLFYWDIYLSIHNGIL